MRVTAAGAVLGAVGATYSATTPVAAFGFSLSPCSSSCSSPNAPAFTTAPGRGSVNGNGLHRHQQQRQQRRGQHGQGLVMKSAIALPSKGKASLNAGLWRKIKTKDIFRAAIEGDLRKRDFTRALASRAVGKSRSLSSTFRKDDSNSANEAASSTGAVEALDIEAGWNRRGVGSAISRSLEIYLFAIKFGLKEAKLRKVTAEERSEARVILAAKLREGLLRLGPTFIKLGQLLSTRIDVVPPEYIKELVLLQDQVPGFSVEKAKQIIEEDLGSPVDEIYDNFSEVPLAAASLGQVHTAYLKGTDQKVAVKVQRQGLKSLFDQDLQNLKLAVTIFDKLDPKFDGADRDWVRVYEESAKLLYREIDYNIEAQNAITFANNFKDTKYVKVPGVYTNLTSERVITMEFVPGIKVNDLEAIDAAGIDRKLLAKRSAEAYLTQLCRFGFFHCDPHPGNVACDADYGGSLVFYDFGMVDEFQPNVRSGFVNLIFATYEDSYKGVCDALQEMGILRKGADRISVEKIARSFLGEFTKQINDKQPWVQELDKADAKTLRKERRAKLGEDLLSVSSDVPFKFPPVFTFVFRAFTSLDGIGKGLDPSYDLTRLAQPFLKELLDLKDGSVFVTLGKSFLEKVGWRPEDIKALVQQPRRVSRVDDTIQKLEAGDLKLRVRVLEAERAFSRMELVQSNLYNTLAFGTFFNAGLILLASTQALMPIRGCFALAAVFGIQVPIGLLKVKKQDKKFKTYGLR